VDRPDRAETERFLRALVGSVDVPVTFQTFDDREGKEQSLARVLHGTLAEHWDELVRLNAAGAGVFFMVNEGDGRGRKAVNVRALRALFVDDDTGKLAPGALKLAPSIVVQSRNGIHAYWKLRPGEPLDRFEPAQVALAKKLGTDPAVKDLPRVMRLPGFLHRKGEPFLVHVVQVGEQIIPAVTEVLDGFDIIAQAEQPKLTPRLVRVNDDGRKGRYATGALQSAVEAITAAPVGQRNNTLNRQGCGLGQLVAGDVLPRDAAEKVLEAAGRDAGLSAAETRATVRSGLNAGEKEPRGLPPATLPLSDLGNAQRLVRLHGDDLRYCHPWGAWLAFDGARWKVDDTAQVERFAKGAVRSIAKEVEDAKDEKEATKLLSHALKSQQVQRHRAMIDLARSEDGIPVLPALLDADPMLLNVANGTIDLRTGELRPHRREDLITKLAPVDFDPDAQCPMWTEFLRRIMNGDESLIGFLRRAAGYALTGDVGAHVLFFFHGAGRNGKTTFVNTLFGLLGDYAVKVPTEILLAKRGERHPTTLTMLAGARFVSCNEANEGRKFDLAVLKDLTGGDMITAHRMRENDWTWRPSHKLFFTANSKPRVTESSTAVWERMMLVPFAVEIPRDERDPHLLEKLKSEWPGILAWAVRGCAAWRAEGEGRKGLGVPAPVEDATSAYRVEEDVIGSFVEDRCVLLPTARVSKPELHKEFLRWATDNSEPPLGKHEFNARVAMVPGVDGTGRTGKARLWTGIGIRTAPTQTEMREEARA